MSRVFLLLSVLFLLQPLSGFCFQCVDSAGNITYYETVAGMTPECKEQNGVQLNKYQVEAPLTGQVRKKGKAVARGAKGKLRAARARLAKKTKAKGKRGRKTPGSKPGISKKKKSVPRTTKL